MMADEAKFLKEEGAAAVLLVSEKWYGLLNMGTGVSREYQPGPLPAAYMTRENATLLWRLLDAGAVEAEINIEASFSAKPVTGYNTVAEIKGSEKPDEVVIIGGHLDSWDLGTGATDNGTGSMAVLAAARALVKSGVRPKRTIRFVLFTGEEQGLDGSFAYVKQHKAELANHLGDLVLDDGQGPVKGFQLGGRDDLVPSFEAFVHTLSNFAPKAEATTFLLTMRVSRLRGAFRKWRTMRRTIIRRPILSTA